MPQLSLIQRVAASVVAIVTIYGALKWLLPVLTRRSRYQIDHIIISAIRTPSLVLLALAAAWWIIGGNNSPLIRALFVSATVVAFWWLSANIIKDVITSYALQTAADTSAAWDDVLLPIVRGFATPLILVIGIISWLVYAIGIDFSTVLTAVGAFSFLLIFALQDPLSNLFSGIYLLMDQPFQLGDFVQLEDGNTYIVEGMGGRVTQLYDVTKHTTVYRPNTKLAAEQIINITKPTVELRVELEVGIGYESDAPLALSILEDICERHPHILSNPSTKEERLRRESSKATGPQGRILQLSAARLGVEYRMRDKAARLALGLDLAAQLAREQEAGGLSKLERHALSAWGSQLSSEFADLRQDLTVWLGLTMHEIVFYKFESNEPRLQSLLQEPLLLSAIDPDVLRANITNGTVSAIGSRASWREEFYSSGVVLSTIGFGHRLGDAGTVSVNELLSIRERIQRELPEIFMLFDARNIYARWHRLVRKVDQELSQLVLLERRTPAQEFLVDYHLEQTRDLLRRNFPMPPERWQWPDAKITGFGDSTLNLSIEFFIDNLVARHYEGQDDTFSDIRYAIMKEFEAAGIEIPFPQSEIRFRSPLTNTSIPQPVT